MFFENHPLLALALKKNEAHILVIFHQVLTNRESEMF